MFTIAAIACLAFLFLRGLYLTGFNAGLAWLVAVAILSVVFWPAALLIALALSARALAPACVAK